MGMIRALSTSSSWICGTGCAPRPLLPLTRAMSTTLPTCAHACSRKRARRGREAASNCCRAGMDPSDKHNAFENKLERERAARNLGYWHINSQLLHWFFGTSISYMTGATGISISAPRFVLDVEAAISSMTGVTGIPTVCATICS